MMERKGKRLRKNYLRQENVEGYKCHRLSHFQNDCPKWEEEANYASFNEHEDMLLMTYVKMMGLRGSRHRLERKQRDNVDVKN